MKLLTLILILSTTAAAMAQDLQISEEHREPFQRSLFTLAFASGCSRTQNDPTLLQDATVLLARTLQDAGSENSEATAKSMAEAAYSRSAIPQANGVNVYNERTCSSLAATIAQRLAE